MNATENQKKLIALLNQMFQFDQADLDFGIYRIMNMKRDEISDYLNNRLIKDINDGISELASTENANKSEELKNQIETIKNSLLPDDLKQQSIDKLTSQLNSLKTTNLSDLEGDVYNHLINFFSRYYDDGDFISQRRYKDGAYVIPYEGEEVKLVWANEDQYYVKTAEYFNDYVFDYHGKKVMFKVIDAEVEKDNNKSNVKRFFVLHDEKHYEIKDGTLIIYVEYRASEYKKQYDASKVIFDTLKEEIKDMDYISMFIAPNSKDKSEFEKQLYRYTAKNTYDYFIHKDLGKFLRRELDFYIKNDVLFLDDINPDDMGKTKEYLVKAKVIKNVASKIIDFLAQIEDFEKKLYLKKKLVVDTQYCITLDKIDESFYPEIAANEEQRKEWVKLFAIDEIKPVAATLIEPEKVGYTEPLTIEFLKQNPYLVLDTKFFSEDFKDRLVATIDNLDESLNGLLINSDNYQAIRLLAEKKLNTVKAIYLDPPYNTNDSGFLYKNNYKHSSWASMIYERVHEAFKMLSDDGVLFITIDDEEVYDLKETLDEAIGKDCYIGTIVIESNPRGRGINSFYATCHEYCLCYARNPECVEILDQELTEEQEQEYKQKDGEVSYRTLPFRRSGGWSTPADRPNSEFPLFFDKSGMLFAVGGERSHDVPAEYSSDYVNVLENDSLIQLPFQSFVQKYPDAIKIMPVDTDGKRRVWRWSDRKKILEAGLKGDFLLKKNGINYSVQLKDFIKAGRKPKTIWVDSKYDSSSHGTNLLKGLFGERYVFPNPKSVYSTEDTLKTVVGNDFGATIEDFFGGSGTTAHAVIDLNRNDEGNRKFVLCEMGDYCNTVTKPRIEKVIYSSSWDDGKPLNREGSSCFFEYAQLESYEDTLNNVAFDSKLALLPEGLKEEYILKYCLDQDSSKSVFSIMKLANPFDYRMTITKKQESKYTKVDLVESFNYLIGLYVERSYETVKTGAEFNRLETGCLEAKLVKGQEYRIKIVEGHLRSGKRVLVLWRDMTDDIEKDNAVLDAVLAKQKIEPNDAEYDFIYINGDNNLVNVNGSKVFLIEDEMKKRMFED